MKYFTSILLTLLTAQVLSAQTTFCGQLTLVENTDAQLIFAVSLQGSDDQFNLGTSNIQLGFDETMFSNPALVSTTLTMAPFPVYNMPTVTEPGTGQLSLNIELNVDGFGDQMAEAPSFTEIARISLDKSSPDAAPMLTWTYNGGTTGTVIFDDNGIDQPQIFATTDACLEDLTAAALPVELLAFTARATGKAAHLDWSTTQERDNHGFHVQHSLDGRNFTHLQFVPGRNVDGAYHYTHASPTVGVNYYRLVQEDRDGTQTVSPVRPLHFAPAAAPDLLYPNPANEVVNLRAFGTDTTVDVFDANGRVMLANQQPGALPVRDLPNGWYTVAVTTEGQVKHLKLLVQH